jgi:hypothetical protein
MSLRTFLIAAWALVLGLLAWAASGRGAAPASAWDATTFPTRHAPEGRAVARDGGYAAPGVVIADRDWSARPAAQDCVSGADRDAANAYVDLGR